MRNPKGLEDIGVQQHDGEIVIIITKKYNEKYIDERQKKPCTVIVSIRVGTHTAESVDELVNNNNNNNMNINGDELTKTKRIHRRQKKTRCRIFLGRFSPRLVEKGNSVHMMMMEWIEKKKHETERNEK